MRKSSKICKISLIPSLCLAIHSRALLNDSKRAHEEDAPKGGDKNHGNKDPEIGNQEAGDRLGGLG